MQAALDAAAQGEEVVLIDDQPALGGHLRYSGSSSNASNAASMPDSSSLGESGADLTALVQRVLENSNITVFTNATCFRTLRG